MGGSSTDESRMVVIEIRSLSKILNQDSALQVVNLEFSEEGENITFD